MQFGVKGSVVEIVAEAQAQAVVALHFFEMERLPVCPHEVRFARSDDEVGSVDVNGDLGGSHAGDVDGEFHGIGKFPAVVVRLPVVRLSGIPHSATATEGDGGRDDRVHGK